MIKIGSKVKFRQHGRVYVRQIRPARDSYDREMVTPDSPIGQAMIGKKPGDRRRQGRGNIWGGGGINGMGNHAGGRT